MGGGNWSDNAYDSIKTTYSGKSASQIFTKKTVTKDTQMKDVEMRECRDSVDHPNSEAIGVFLDITSSMGDIPRLLAQEKLGNLMKTLIDNKVEDASVLFGAIGDQVANRYPIQIGQFESETSLLDKWLTSLVLEGGGGGDVHETYSYAWLMAARHTSIDCFEKRGVKGLLFTIGDEGFHEVLSARYLEEYFGKAYADSKDLSSRDILAEVQKKYHVFHIHADESPSYGKGKHSYERTQILNQWRDALGERLLIAETTDSIPELIATTAAVMRGANLQNVVKSMDSRIAASVSNALVKITGDVATQSDGVILL